MKSRVKHSKTLYRRMFVVSDQCKPRVASHRHLAEPNDGVVLVIKMLRLILYAK